MRKFTGSLLFLALVFMCGAIVSCDKDNGGGSGGRAAVSLLSTISGPGTLANGASGEYKYALTDSKALVAEYQWKITGVGIITKNKGSVIVVTATGDGVIKIKLRVKNADGVWSPWDTMRVTVSQTPAPDPPTFVVTLDFVGAPYAASGLPATGTAGTWSLTGADSGPGTTKNFTTSNYTIGFSGDVSGLPDTVPVTVTWLAQNGSTFWWDNNFNSTGSTTFDISKATGGSIGQGGTAASFPAPRPMVYWDNPPFDTVGMTLGTVTFTAPGVQTMTLTITNANVRN